MKRLANKEAVKTYPIKACCGYDMRECIRLLAVLRYLGLINIIKVGGSGTQDPLSKREIKAADGDNYAYFRGATFSSDNGINTRSILLNDNSIYTPKAAKLTTGNVGTTLKRNYNTTAPGNVYYYMRAVAAGGRVKVTGYYCP